MSDIVMTSKPSNNATVYKRDYMTDYNGFQKTWKQWKVAQKGD